MEPPEEPDIFDCCNSGCNPCIFDVYREQLAKFEKQKESLLQTESKNYLSQTRYSSFKLIKMEKHTTDTYLFTFCTCSNERLSYFPGQHLILKGTIENKVFSRAYTPVPLGSDPCCFVILVRIYRDGKMSNILKNLCLGCETYWRGPYGSYVININLKYLFCIAQGTGIAPLFAVIKTLVENEECYTFIKLYFCCHSVDDILLHQYLYDLHAFWNFSYEVFVNKRENNSSAVKYKEVVNFARLGCDNVKTYLEDKLNEDIQVLICGSNNFSVQIKDYVVNCGLDDNKIYVF